VTSGNTAGGISGGSYEGNLTNCSNQATVSGETYIGGICGYNYNGNVITACFNSGHVKGKTDVGGIVGGNESEISACYNTGLVQSNREAGGISGTNYYAMSEINSCYNTGNISGSIVGGICGYVDTSSSIVSNCYWTGNASTDIGTGKTSNSKKFGNGTAGTGWPTNNSAIYWGVASGANGGTNGYYWQSLGSFGNSYPQLWWEK
jgi:hypothetical protein